MNLTLAQDIIDTLHRATRNTEEARRLLPMLLRLSACYLDERARMAESDGFTDDDAAELLEEAQGLLETMELDALLTLARANDGRAE